MFASTGHRIWRRPRLRTLIAGVVALLVISACTSENAVSETPELAATNPIDQVVDEFTANWSAGRIYDAAAFTSDAPAARVLFERINQTLHPEHLDITIESIDETGNGSAHVAVDMAWTLPVVGQWRYPVRWEWEFDTVTEQWQLQFTPAVIHPDLGRQQSLAVRTLPTIPGTVVDRYDVQLLSPVRVYSLVVILDQVQDFRGLATELVQVLEPFDQTLKSKQLAQQLTAARDDGQATYTVINVRDTDFATIEAAVSRLAPLSITSSVRDLAPTPHFATTLLSQAGPIATAMTAGEPGWEIVTIDAVGDDLETVARQAAEPGPKVTLTLDPALQQAAQDVVAPVKEPAVLVAIQPSSGEILAVGQNAAADKQGPIALTGQYPPGSIFKIVTAAAAIDAGITDVKKTVNCPGSWTEDFRTIRNQNFALGKVSLLEAFARSCNTTFAMLAADLPDDALPQTAAQFGIGVDFDIAGIITYTGAVPVAESVLERAENGFGQGRDLVTALSAAVMAATAATGSMPMPILIRDTTTTSDLQPEPLASQVAEALPSLMRAVVTDGTARALRDSGTVYAKTGTAEYVADNGEIAAHAWTVGYRDDVAFAALIVGGGSSGRTNDLVADFLQAIPAP